MNIAKYALAAAMISVATASAAADLGFGTSRPSIPDVSTSHEWHVYKLDRDGVRYIQINDDADNVRAAVATAGGQYLVLPIGSDTEHVSTTTAAPGSNLIYKDGYDQIFESANPDGTTIISVSLNCSDGDCGVNRIAPQKTYVSPDMRAICSGDDCGVARIRN